MDKGISHVLSMSILLYGLQRPIFNSQDKEPYSFVGLKAQEKTGLLLMPTAKVTKNVSAAEGGGNVLCSILISIKTKAWLYSFRLPYFGCVHPFAAGERRHRLPHRSQMLPRKARMHHIPPEPFYFAAVFTIKATDLWTQ